ncbi:tetratricopeptide repeat protein [Terasakiella pusilla]|jgi:TPR repeat protein|uniref:tetratricopeptide repeat protein n=1 Tax=Terasakiella pusilla TaxID=64973 RepID=UPI003AA7FB3B
MRFLLFVFTVLIAAPVQAQTAVDGYKAYNSGDYETAKSIIPRLAEQGDPIAMNAMGNWHADGILVEKNQKKACDWYEKSAQADYAAAQFNYAYCFDKWGGRKRSAKNHLKWLTKAGEQSYLNAQLRLMLWYTQTNRNLAQYWGEKAAAQNSATARVILWFANLDDNLKQQASFWDITCVTIRQTLLHHNWRSCDP